MQSIGFMNVIGIIRRANLFHVCTVSVVSEYIDLHIIITVYIFFLPMNYAEALKFV